MFETLQNIPNWQFMQEPLYRWFVFFGALMGISFVWSGVLGLMH